MDMKPLVLAALLGLSGTAALAANASIHGAPGVRNGLTPNGLHLNGASLNGLQVNGLHLNGLHVNGLSVNGLSINGLMLRNGLGINGLSGVHPAKPGANVDRGSAAIGGLPLLASTALAK